MSARQPYRPAISYEEAAAELKRNAGSQFDPWVVEALVGLLASGATFG